MSCCTICMIWVATRSSSASHRVAYHQPKVSTTTTALKYKPPRSVQMRPHLPNR